PDLLAAGLAQKPDFYSEYIDGARFPDEDYRAAFYRYLALKYGSTRFDVVIAIHQLALDFVSAYRHELFADTPIVFLSENPSTRRLPNSAGTIATQDYSATLSLALELQPDTTQVFVVIGSSMHDNIMERGARAQFASFAPRLTF